MNGEREWVMLGDFMYFLAISVGAMAWWRKGSQEEDETIATANDILLAALSDADAGKKVEAVTDLNWRDQITVEKALDMHEERELRRFGRRN